MESGLWKNLTPEQQKMAMEYDGPDSFGSYDTPLDEVKSWLLENVAGAPHHYGLKFIGDARWQVIMDATSHLHPKDANVERVKYVMGLYDPTPCRMCGNMTKKNKSVDPAKASLWCSISCKNKDPSMRASVSNALRDPELNKRKQEARRKTTIERYGVDHISKTEENKVKVKATRKDKDYEQTKSTMLRYFGKDAPIEDHGFWTKQFEENHSAIGVAKATQSGMCSPQLHRWLEKIGFDAPYPSNSSSSEKEVADMLSQYTTVIRGDRSLVGKELDIYLPDHKLAIEFNGVFWHSANTVEDKNKNRHLIKTEACEQNDITLVHVFEDEWVKKQEIVTAMLKAKIGIYDKTIGARQCEYEIMDARAFLDDNHIQGRINGTHHCLTYDGEIVAAMTVGMNRFSKNEETDKELLRFAVKAGWRVQGAFSRLFSKVNETLITYSDRRWFTGKTYAQFGEYIGSSEPGYYWVNKAKLERISRYRTQKHKLSDFLGEKFDPSLTEVDNMFNNGYRQIYDCGNRKFILRKKS